MYTYMCVSICIYRIHLLYVTNSNVGTNTIVLKFTKVAERLHNPSFSLKAFPNSWKFSVLTFST